VHLSELLSSPPEHLQRALRAFENTSLTVSVQVPKPATGTEAEQRHPPRAKVVLQQPNHKLKPAEIADLIRSYQGGSSIKGLGRTYRIHEQTVRAHLERAGLALRPQRVLSEQQTIEIVALYAEGQSMRELAAQYNVSYASVRNYLLGAGVELRPAVRPKCQAAAGSECDFST